MSSNPPGSCCYKGVQHEGEAVGRFEQGDGFEVYISEAADKSTDKGILMYVNNQAHNTKLIEIVSPM